jgi:hypothetical protein
MELFIVPNGIERRKRKENGERLDWTESFALYQYGSITNGTLKTGPPSARHHDLDWGSGRGSRFQRWCDARYSSPLHTLLNQRFEYLIKPRPTEENWGSLFAVSVVDAVRLIGGVEGRAGQIFEGSFLGRRAI